MTNTHDVIPARYNLIGYRKDNDRMELMWEIPVALWPLMGSLAQGEWGDGYGEYPLKPGGGEAIAVAMKSDLGGRDYVYHVSREETGARQWKHIWLNAADQLDEIATRPELDEGRVCKLLRGYALVTRSLLYADVNGGLDEEYEDFPEAPKL